MNTFFASIEAKVKASTTAATVAAAVVGLLGAYVFHGNVPGWVQPIIGAVVTGGLTFAAGWLTKHTPRAADAVVAPVTPMVPPPAGPPAGV